MEMVTSVSGNGQAGRRDSTCLDGDLGHHRGGHKNTVQVEIFVADRGAG